MNKYLRLLRYDLPLHFVLLLTNWLPDNTPFLALRGWLAHFFLGSCGKNLRLGRNISVYNPSMIHFGDDIYIAYGCIFIGVEVIRVEDEVIFGPYCIIVSGNHTKKNGSFRYGQAIDSPIRVGKGSWIGAHVTIIAGVDLGPGCLIAANSSVLTEAIPPNTMIAGNPAKTVRSDI